MTTSHEALSFAHEPGRAQSWEQLDDDLRWVIEGAIDRVANELLEAGFVGAYLHGSLATGSFYRPKSDVDALFVVERRVPGEQRASVANTLVDLSDELPLVGDYEVCVLRRAETRHFHHPLPYELHYSSSQKAWIREGKVDFSPSRTDPHLAAHCTAVRARGVVLSGDPIESVFGSVPVCSYRESILEDLHWILEDDHLLESPFYGVLNSCRVLALEAEGWEQVLSKDEGGEWAFSHVPREHQAIIAQALACYRSKEDIPSEQRQTDGHPWDAKALKQFRDYVKQKRAA